MNKSKSTTKSTPKASCSKAPIKSNAPKQPKQELRKMYAPAVLLNGLTYQESASGKLVSHVVNPYDLVLYKSKVGALARAHELAKGYKRSEHALPSTVCYSLEEI